MLWLQELKYSAVILQDSVHVFQKEFPNISLDLKETRSDLGLENCFISPTQICWDESFTVSDWFINDPSLISRAWRGGWSHRVVRSLTLRRAPAPQGLWLAQTQTTWFYSYNNVRPQDRGEVELENPFYINDLCLFFRVSVQRKHLAKMFWADDAASKTNVLDRRQRSEWLCVEERKECVCVYLVFCS